MMAGDSQRVMETTTINYNGMVAVLDPTASWAAKWLHVGVPTRCWYPLCCSCICWAKNALLPYRQEVVNSRAAVV